MTATHPLPTTNWGGNVTYRAARFHQPSTVNEIASIVRGSTQVKALGTRHSFNRAADTTGDLVSLAKLNRVIALDETRSTVTVEPGITYGELGAYLHERGFALANLPSLPHVCVGGAVQTGTHGSGTQNLSSAVVALQMVTADGEIREFSRDHYGAAFDGTVVSLGLLGIVTQLTLLVRRSFLIRQTVYRDVPLADVTNHYSRLIDSAYSVSLFTDWQTERVNQVWMKQRVASHDSPEPAFEFLTGRKSPVKLHPIAGTLPDFCTEQGTPGPAFERLPHFRPDHEPSSAGAELQSEYFIPRRDIAIALSAMQSLSLQLREQLMICEVRSINADPLWLSPAFDRESVAIHCTWRPNEAAVLRLLNELIEPILAPFHPRPHWGKVFTLAASDLNDRYPMMPRFKQLRDEMDPAGKFMNEFGGRLFPPNSADYRL